MPCCGGFIPERFPHLKIILLVIGVLAFAGSAVASETCIASVFSEGYSRPMADGVRHRTSDLLVAHKTLPFGTVVRVTVIATNASVIATVRDRGPFVRGRCIDLSPATARALGISGIARVRVDVISQIRSSKSVEDQNSENLKIKPERTK